MQLQRKELMAENADRKEWERKAGYDALTGLANRQLFMPMLTNEVERAQRNAFGGSFCLGLIDIDHFKSVNDNYGHPVGDKVLESIAQTMVETLRSMDVPARYGGEEFAILFPETSLNNAADAMERLRANIERSPIRAGNHVIRITVSGGLAEFGHHIKTVDDLIQSADSRLYAAKRAGRNQVLLETYRGRHC
jgi:diguanylate cyclase (GGDEF)-like protein